MDHCKKRRAATGVRLDQAADVDIALRHDAIERRHHLLIDLLLAQHHELRLLRLDGGFLGDRRLLLRSIGEPVIVGLLTRGSTLWGERRGAFSGDTGQIAVRLGLGEGRLDLGEGGLCLGDLMIELRTRTPDAARRRPARLGWGRCWPAVGDSRAGGCDGCPWSDIRRFPRVHLWRLCGHRAFAKRRRDKGRSAASSAWRRQGRR